MLDRQYREKILKALVDGALPESKLFKEKKEEILNFLRKSTLDVLTEDEKKFIETYPSSFKTQPCFCLRHVIKEYFDVEFEPKYDNDYYNTLGYCYRERFEFFDINNGVAIKYPLLVNDIKDLEESHPDLFQKFKTYLIELIDIRLNEEKKIFLLRDLLEESQMTLTLLKKYYPELYKIAKS